MMFLVRELHRLLTLCQTVCVKTFQCLNRWCTDDVNRLGKLDLKKEEKEWEKNVPLSVHLKNELHVLHRVSSMVLSLRLPSLH